MRVGARDGEARELLNIRGGEPVPPTRWKDFTNYLEDRERTRQYVDGIENGKIKEGIILDGVSRSLTEMRPIEIENDSFSGLRIDRADVVSQIEDWLLVVSVAKRESQRPPPYDQYKKQGEMEIKKLGL